MQVLEQKMTKEDKKIYDDCFYCKQQRWGTWNSYDLENKALVTSLTEEECVKATRFMLKLKQENLLNEVGVTYEGTVGGKL